MALENALKVIQIIISIALIGVILLQARGGSIGSLFGGGDGGGITKTRRGLEKTIFQITVGLAVLFVLNAIAQLLLQ